MFWEQVSEKSREIMKKLGDFSPTVHTQEREVKGYTFDEDGGGKTYWTSYDLRNIASACIEVADWLDSRAKQHEV